MRMKKYLLYAWIVSAFCSCSENSIETLPMEVDADCVNIVNDENFVSVSQATEVAGLFLTANGKDAVTTRNGSIEPDVFSGKTVKDIKTVYGEDNTPSMYVINYKCGGFVIVGATKNYYPILAYSETNSMNVEEAMKTGFSIWANETKLNIAESDSWNEEILVKYQEMWASYEMPMTISVTRGTTDDFYQNGMLFRQRMNELYSLCPGYSFGPLSSWENRLPNYQYFVDRAYIYGSPLEFTIIGYKYAHNQVGPLIGTIWDQLNEYNALCPPGCYAGCVAIAMAQIMKYHEWPQKYDWDNMKDSVATVASQRLIADVGIAVDMDYGTGGSEATIVDAVRGFSLMGYNTVRKNHNVSDVISEIKRYGHPVYMRSQTDGPIVSGHAWVCEGVQEQGYNMAYFVEYRTPNSTTSTYSSCGDPSWNNPSSISVSGSTYFYMNWGWNGSGNGWFVSGSANSANGNYAIARQNLYVTPKYN